MLISVTVFWLPLVPKYLQSVPESITRGAYEMFALVLGCLGGSFRLRSFQSADAESSEGELASVWNATSQRRSDKSKRTHRRSNLEEADVRGSHF